MALRILVAVAALSFSTLASAQVHRCTDAAGKTSFSDAPCPTSARRAQQVLGREATDSPADPYAAQRNLESIENASRILQAPTSDAIGDAGGGIIDNGPNGPGGTNRIRAEQDRQRAEIELAAARRRAADERARQAELERRRPPAPSIVSNCDRGGCWDNAGNRYNRAGDGSNFWRSDGKFCRPQGNTFSCN